MKKYEAYTKVCRTIDTCTSLQHIEVAAKLADRFKALFCGGFNNWMCDSIDNKLVNKESSLKIVSNEPVLHE